ncbi:hypothetical protein [Pseudoduganella namucuonensis]|uniref:Uncharacterized protein n=1 Tax=Pseudoduganella namucuonensis TaxID=1035707 RepID=A0A1I7KC34_9BURK|nr:hypothetical protein [Pseudoduganella namucuonensis]SFU94967.1 hypothetical protein SAMN05216552_101633 [Pseudoduganella namucuonensis]
MRVSESVFVELQFFVLVALSLLLPAAIYGYMMWKRALSRLAVFGFGIGLLVLAGANLVLLRTLAEMATKTPSLRDDLLFSSELSVALYLFPALFAGVGINIISHLLVSHLTEAERRYSREHGER